MHVPHYFFYQSFTRMENTLVGEAFLFGQTDPFTLGPNDPFISIGF